MKRYDPITHRYPRTTEEAFGFSPFAIERPRENSLVQFWLEIVLALSIVGAVILIFMGAA